jgi:hypothetical protein
MTRPSWFSSSPTSVPVSRVRLTAAVANSTVIRRESQNSGSLNVVVKLASPTHWMGAAPLIWGSP